MKMFYALDNIFFRKIFRMGKDPFNKLLIIIQPHLKMNMQHAKKLWIRRYCTCTYPKMDGRQQLRGFNMRIFQMEPFIKSIVHYCQCYKQLIASIPPPS